MVETHHSHHSMSSSASSSSGQSSSDLTVLPSLISELCFWEPTPKTGQLHKQSLPTIPENGQAATKSATAAAATAVVVDESRVEAATVEREQATQQSQSSSSSSVTRQEVEQPHTQGVNGIKSPASSPPESALSDEEKSPPLEWKAAVDPASGRTYYYHTITRRTQWDKPEEIRALEKRRKKMQRKRDLAFFQIMENNIKTSLARGELIPGLARAATAKQGPPQEPLQPLPPLRVRTISGMNENILSQLHHSNVTTDAPPSSQSQPPPRGPSSSSSSQSRPNAINRPNPTTPTAVPAANRPGGMEGRPPLPQRRAMPASESQDSLEFSPDAHRQDDSSATPQDWPQSPTMMTGNHNSADDLRGEALLDGPVLDEAGVQDQLTPAKPAAGLARPSVLNNHMRRNTGGTIYVRSTMDNPDINATIKCVCGVFRAHVVQSAQQPPQQRSPVSVSAVHLNLDMFRDDFEKSSRYSSSNNSSGKDYRSTLPVPSLTEIEAFYQEFFRRSQMEHDTIIMSLIYVERLIKETNGALTPAPENWASVLFSCMILASKVWDDLSMWNVDFSNVSVASGLSAFSLKRINQLELAVLTCLNFDVKVPASEYAKYYFLIRTMLSRSGLLDNALQPLRKEDAKLLEDRTQQYQASKINVAAAAKPGNRDRRARSIDFSWFVGGPAASHHSRAAAGPVLKDTLCLEQLVSMQR